MPNPFKAKLSLDMVTRHNYREVSKDAEQRCTNCKFGVFDHGDYGRCSLYVSEHLPSEISKGHVCDRWESKR
jgi:hypothetical protein